jgi:hypothetical protein
MMLMKYVVSAALMIAVCSMNGSEESSHLRDASESSSIGSSMLSFSWHSCAVVGVVVVAAVVVATVFYGFDRMISDGKYTRNVVREVTNQIISKVDKNNIILMTITQVLQRHSDDHAVLINGQRNILRELIEQRKGVLHGQEQIFKEAVES